MPEFDYKRHLINSGMNIIGSGTLANAPVASTSNLGTFYLETGDPLWPNGRLYMSRYNGNYVNNAVISATDRVIPSSNFNANLDFKLDIEFRQDSSDSIAYTGLFCQGTATPNTRGIWIERSGAGGLGSSYTVSFYNSSASTKSLFVNGIIDGKWHFLEVIRVGNSVTIYNDGVLIGTIDMTGFTVNTVTTTTIGAQWGGARAINGNVSKCSVVCSTGCFTYEFNQSSGTTILDTSGNGNNGTLTDALPTDFWKIGWTPVQWDINVIGYGLLANAPVATTLNQNQFYMSTDFGLCKYVGGFLNEGIDYVSAGRPSWITFINPNVAFSFFTTLRIKKTVAVAQYLISLADGDAANTQQFAILFNQNGGVVSLRIGGVEKSEAYVLPVSDTRLSICITSDGIISDLWIGGVKIISGLVNGGYMSSQNLNIFGYSFNPSYNAEALFFQSSVFYGYSSNGLCSGLTQIDKYDMNKWDGSITGKSDMGNSYTVTKGVPFTELSYACVPVNLL